MNSAAAISPAWYGYVAAQIVLNTQMLFSNTPVSKYFILGASGTKNAIDKHHIFPKNYLNSIGISSDRDRNQIANFTYLDYATNIEISDKAPQDYVLHYRQKLGEDGYKRACEDHALPSNFEKMEYADFLNQRRMLMAQTVRKAYSPVWPDGKKHSRNVYAHTREECEEKLKQLIVDMKKEIAEAKAKGIMTPPEISKRGKHHKSGKSK